MSASRTLLSTQALAQQLGRADLTIMDCRFSLAATDAGEVAYRHAHIPGAQYAHLDRDLSDHRKSLAGRHPWPDAADFTARLQAWGIAPQQQVMVYDDSDGAFAARLWFLLRALGHERVAVLDGGWQQWTADGLPIETTLPVVTAVGSYDAQFDDSRLLDSARVQSHLNQGGILLDARAAERFRGEIEPIDRIAGHVPGAINRPYAENLSHGRFKSAAQLASEFAALLGEHHADDVVAMCGSGVTACHHLLAMEHAGLPGAQLFTGSWSGWISDPSRPIATGPN